VADAAERRRTFVPVVLAGLAAAGLAAVAGHQPWAHGEAAGGIGELSTTLEAGRVPAANALSLVVLACWGVLLVTRGLVRRIVSVLGVVSSLGVVVTVVTGFASAPEGVRDAYADLGVAHAEVTRSVWFWVAAVAAVLTVATTVLAVRLVPSWPEMGRRYDAPADAVPVVEEAQGPVEERENLELWKAMDEGRDPTA
jgi:uncharacterized membrane protein (TIGR02234 family)